MPGFLQDLSRARVALVFGPEKSGLTARDLVTSGMSGELLSIEGNQRVDAAVRLMAEYDFSQISITRDKRLVAEFAPLESQWLREQSKQARSGSSPTRT